MKVLNKTQITHTIKLVHADGTPDSINLNPGRPVTLQPGMQIDPTKIKEYMSILKTDPPLASLLTPAKPAPAPAQKAPSDE